MSHTSIKKIVSIAHKIEESWDSLDSQEKGRQIQLFSKMLLENESESIRRLAPHLKTDMSLRCFLNFVIPLERQINREKQEADFLVNHKDTQPKPENLMPATIVLDCLRSSFNVGNIFRSAEFYGVEYVYTCGYTADPENIRTQKCALGADSIVNWKSYLRVETALQELKNKGVKIYALETSPNATPLNEAKFEFPMALLLGNERFGLDDQQLCYADEIIQIPSFGYKNSLNVATCLGIVVHQIRQAFEK